MIHLANQKGYQLACVCGCNAVFVREELYPSLKIENNGIDAMFDDSRTETKIFQLYDNTIALVGKQVLNWSKIPFTAEDFQVVPPEKRYYSKRLDASMFSDSTAAASDPLSLRGGETFHVDRLHEALGLSEPLNYPRELKGTPLDRWKMEVNDSPIFRYLYSQFQPKRHLEFGTWQGAGTVYCLEECDATVWTINLPFGEDKPEGGDQYAGDGDSFGLGTAMAIEWAKRIGLPEQSGYRTDSYGFIGRFFLEKGFGHRVCQIYCDSTKWDDSAYPDGFFDSILVDGGHTPEIVASDTQKALRLLRPGGLMLWHDFCPPVMDKFPVTRGVRDGLASLLPELREQFGVLGWIDPSWILVGVKKLHRT
jgi:hypothetical protein